MSWKASAWSLETHVKVNNNAKIPVLVFAYNFTDPAYGWFKDSSELQPMTSAVLKAASDGAGRIQIGLAIGVARKYGEGFVEWADVVASADYADHRYKLRLRYVADNTECSIEQHGDGSLFIAGEKVSKCDAGDTWVVQGPSATGKAILQTIKTFCSTLPSGKAAHNPAATDGAHKEVPLPKTTKPQVSGARKGAVDAGKNKTIAKGNEADEWEVVGRSSKGSNHFADGEQKRSTEEVQERESGAGVVSQRTTGDQKASEDGEATDAKDAGGGKAGGGSKKRKNRKGGKSGGQEATTASTGAAVRANQDLLPLALCGGIGVAAIGIINYNGFSLPAAMLMASALAIICIKGKAFVTSPQG